MTTWREFWDSAHSIYVSERHKDVHYRDVAEQLAAFVPGPDARVLDHGSGEAIHAGPRRGAGARAAPVRLPPRACAPSIAARFAGNPKIKVIAPEDVERLPDASLDLVFANSLVQYLTAAELDRMLALWRRLLAPGGTLIVADVIPPHVGRAERRLRAAALRRRERVPRRGARRPHAHRAVALSRACAASSASRAMARRNSSRSCARPGLSAERLAEKCRAQSGAHDVSRALRVILTVNRPS